MAAVVVGSGGQAIKFRGEGEGGEGSICHGA